MVQDGLCPSVLIRAWNGVRTAGVFTMYKQKVYCPICGKRMVHIPKFIGCNHWYCNDCNTWNWPAELSSDDDCPVCKCIHDVDWVGIIDTGTEENRTEIKIKCSRCNATTTIMLPISICDMTQKQARILYEHRNCKKGPELGPDTATTKDVITFLNWIGLSDPLIINWMKENGVNWDDVRKLEE